MFNSMPQFYTSSEWRKLRRLLMVERTTGEGLICAHCGEVILRDYDAILHHVVELTPQNVNDASIAYNPENLVFVHAMCHNEIHNRFGGRVKSWQKKVYYIYGAPCSGKSTFVRENMQAGDLVLDIDRLWSALSGQPEYIKPNAIKPIVFNARNAIFESIKMRAGSWQQAFVVEGGALIGDRMRRIEAIGAESIFIDAPKEECLQRLASDEERAAVRDQWERYIEEWFSKYQPDIV